MSIETPDRQATPERPHEKRNYWSSSIEGGLYIGGLAFVSPHSVLPSMVETLGGADWMIAFVPQLMMMGIMLPQIFMANFIERLESYKPFVVRAGVLQRLPFLVAGLLLLYLAGRSLENVALWVVFLTPLISGMCGGLAMAAWAGLQVRIVRSTRRSSMQAIRNLLGALVGIGAGWVVQVVLSRHPGVYGYGLLHLFTFAFVLASFVIFVMIREPRVKTRPVKRLPLHKGLQELVRILRVDRAFRLFILAQFCGFGIFCLVPFLAVGLQRMADLPAAFVGNFVAAQMAGGFAGNMLAGWLGDKTGPKRVFIGALSVFAVMISLLLLPPSAGMSLVIFALLGVGYDMFRVAMPTLLWELAPEERLPSYQAVASQAALAGYLVAGGLASLLRLISPQIWPLAAVAALGVGTSILLMIRLRNTRLASL